ncbi:MAG: hypothetical protein PQJ46_02445 [Spirochaetales bacterium]|nr:hypothetical protein [Spirochaetales bacterium]
MSKITLLNDGTEYSDFFARKIEADGNIVTRLTEKQQDTTSSEEMIEAPKNLEILWNKRSPLSARNAILTILNKYSCLNEAIIIYQPGFFNKTFHEMSSAVYDLQIDRWIKGYSYLLKEIIQLYIKQKEGRLSFILDKGGVTTLTPLENAIYNYLKILLKDLSVLYQNEPFQIFCFESETPKREEFLLFYDKVINDSKFTPGKIHRFGEKKSIFDFVRN